jgi:hypothetical protein
MRIVRKTNQELVVVDSSIWLSIVLSCVSLLFLYRTIIIQAGTVYYLVVGFIGLFSLLFWRKEVVIFDSGRQQTMWNRRRLFRIVSGTIPFSDITGIGMETTSAKSNVLVYRLAILTLQRSVAMSDNYAGDLQNYEKLKREILEFLKLDSGEMKSAPNSALSGGIDDEDSVRSLLRQGRRIDAIQLVRSTQKISLAEATDHVNAIYQQIRAAQ